jgi:hypothetical protein
MLIKGMDTKKSKVGGGGGEGEGFSGKNVEKVCCHSEGRDPKGRRNARMKEKGANDIVSGANNAFGFAVLSRSVWA